MEKIRIGAAYALSYREVEDIKANDSSLRRELLLNHRRSVFEQLIEKLPQDLDSTKAFTIETRLLDGMNLVTKINEIPINIEYLTMPYMNCAPNFGRKLTWKERFKIFVKGEF